MTGAGRFLALVTLATAVPRLAAAGSGSQSDRDVDRPTGRWYGGEIVASDLFGYTALAGGLTARQDAWVAGSAAVFLIGGPLVHLSHGRSARAAGSLALRVAGLYASIGLVAERNCYEGPCGGPMSLPVAFLPLLGAQILDAALSSRERMSPTPATRLARAGGELHLAPVLTVARSTTLFGVGATF